MAHPLPVLPFVLPLEGKFKVISEKNVAENQLTEGKGLLSSTLPNQYVLYLSPVILFFKPQLLQSQEQPNFPDLCILSTQSAAHRGRCSLIFVPFP